MAVCGKCGEDVDRIKWLQLIGRETEILKEERGYRIPEKGFKMKVCRSCSREIERIRELQHTSDQETRDKAWGLIEAIVRSAPKESLNID